ncbi:hypothetical protein DPMN_097574, partial [Dreissena polymorpha]
MGKCNENLPPQLQNQLGIAVGEVAEFRHLKISGEANPPRKYEMVIETQYLCCMKPNIYVGLCEGSSMYRRWYFEVVVDQFEAGSHLPPLLRIGWASSSGFVPYPGGGQGWGCNAAGDDLYSFAFDGNCFWTGAKRKQVRDLSLIFRKGDVVGCLLDLTGPKISFTINGAPVMGLFKDFNLDGLFFPVISMTACVSCRFVLGSEHGKLKYGPPEGHSPAIESLLPKQKLKIEPCFYFGDVQKNIISGPTEVLDYAPFVPQPVDTGNVQLPVYVECVRDKLAENLHEVWAMNKIDQGWSWGEIREDTRKKNPSLTSFEKLPMSEKKYVVTVAFETLRTLLALGYHVSMEMKDSKTNRMKTVKLSSDFLQSNGYKPMPLDLSGTELDEKMCDLVELLAENTHNVWAKDRIKNGWTYGLCEDLATKRSPHLVPYNKVEEHIKRANREAAAQTVKTILAYGYTLEPPTSELGESTKIQSGSKLENHLAAHGLLKATDKSLTETNMKKTRTYRAQLTYAVTAGKWYFECEVLTPGYMKVGWAKESAVPSEEIGMDGSSYAFDGLFGRKWNQGAEFYGKQWKTGDVVGCMLDLSDRTITFSLNGELMMDSLGQEIAFRNIEVSKGYVPAFTVGAFQQMRLNFGQDVNTLKYFTFCGLQEGYEPFCVNMTRIMSLWYTRDQAHFTTVTNSDPSIAVSRIPGGANVAPCLKVTSKTFGTLEDVKLEYLRLSLPVKCKDEFIPSRDKVSHQATLDRHMNLENLRRRELDIEEEQDGGTDPGTENYSDANMSDASIERGSKLVADTLRHLVGTNRRHVSSHNHKHHDPTNSDGRPPSPILKHSKKCTTILENNTDTVSKDSPGSQGSHPGSQGSKGSHAAATSSSGTRSTKHS